MPSKSSLTECDICSKFILQNLVKAEWDLQKQIGEEVPLKIPEGWVWCRWGEVGRQTEAGKSLKAEEAPAEREEWGVDKTSTITFFWNKVLTKIWLKRSNCCNRY